MTLLSLETLTVQRGQCPVVDRATLTIAEGECVGLIGPNGAGKTTLMRGALGLLPFAGQSSLAALPARQRAAQAAWLPQKREIAWPVTVETLVALGRLPHLPAGARLRGEDREAVDRALDRLGLLAYRDRRATELSGGEQARALIARALAQGAPLLMADEPTAGLDPAAQLSVMGLFRSLADAGQGVLVSLHDLTLAARFCTRLVLMSRGQIVADGPPAEVLTPRLLDEVFGIRADVLATDHGPLLQVIEVTR